MPKKTAKKVEAVQKKEHAKQDAAEEPVKKTKGVKAPKEEKEAVQKVKVPTTKDAEKPKKESKAGSEEMKARMAALRAMRKKKSE